MTPFDATLFCTDEDLAIEATADIARIIPRTVIARGADGSLSGGSWTLTTSANLQAQGVVAGTLCVLSGVGGSAAAKNFGAGGETFVASQNAVGTTVLLRGVGQLEGVGQPPSLLSISPVNFVFPTFTPAIRSSSDRIRQQLNFDLAADLISASDLRQATVYDVLRARFLQASDSKDDDYAMEYQKYNALFTDLMKQLVARRKSNYAVDSISVVPID